MRLSYCVVTARLEQMSDNSILHSTLEMPKKLIKGYQLGMGKEHGRIFLILELHTGVVLYTSLLRR